MRYYTFKPKIFLLILLIVLCTIAVFFLFPRAKQRHLAPIVLQYQIYFPTTLQTNLTIFGAQVEFVNAQKASHLPNKLWLQTPLYWHLVEQSPNVYTWPENLETFLPDINHNVILGTRGSPTWSRLDPAWACSAPRSEYWMNYVNMLNAAISRYQVQGVALWNEPEPSPEQTNPEWEYPYFGCWGSSRAELYAQFVQFVYPKIKAAHPNVLVISGEFMGIDTDWDQRAINAGMVGDFFSFHYYPQYTLPETWNWQSKVDTMISFSPTHKWIMSETSMLYSGNCNDISFRQQQGQYASDLRAGFIYSKLSGILWYTLVDNSWQCSDLVNLNERHPAWYSYFGMLP